MSVHRPQNHNERIEIALKKKKPERKESKKQNKKFKYLSDVQHKNCT